MINTKRIVYFIFGCITTRLFLSYAYYKAVNNNQDNIIRYMGIGAIAVSLGFLYIYMSGSRKTGLETGGEMIWWNDLRPIHLLNYLIFGLLALNKTKEAWRIILVDTIIGLAAWVRFHKFL